MKIISRSQKETENFGTMLASKFDNKHNIFLLNGDLGTGKTVFARGFIRELSGDKNLAITSPTFVLSNSYQSKSGKEIRHFDLYRLESLEDAYDLDIENALDNCITLIEWPEIIKNILPERLVEVNFTRISDEEREINLIIH